MNDEADIFFCPLVYLEKIVVLKSEKIMILERNTLVKGAYLSELLVKFQNILKKRCKHVTCHKKNETRYNQELEFCVFSRTHTWPSPIVKV